MVRSMSMYVGYISALRYWRGITASRRAAHIKAVDELLRILGPGKVEVVVADERQRTARRRFTYHVCSQGLPKRSYSSVAKGLYVAKPELSYLQMASKLSLIGLVQLGMEMCGTYRLLPEGGFQGDCPALTTKDSLRRFLLEAQGCYGQEKALQSLEWVVEGSASPRETQTCIRLCLPPRYGGFSCPLPVMNGLMELTQKQQRVSGRSRLYGDLYWPEHNVLLEYNGGEFHASREQMTRDALRANAVSLQGTRMFTVTAGIYADYAAFENMACELRKNLGMRLRAFTDTQVAKRRSLPRELSAQEALSR